MFYRINDKMFNENLATLKSPDRQAKCMRIQFEIKEKLPDIISEILHSDKWLTLVRDENHGLRRVTIKDPYFDSEASVDIWEHEIHVTTAWSTPIGSIKKVILFGANTLALIEDCWSKTFCLQ